MAGKDSIYGLTAGGLPCWRPANPNLTKPEEKAPMLCAKHNCEVEINFCRKCDADNWTIKLDSQKEKKPESDGVEKERIDAAKLRHAFDEVINHYESESKNSIWKSKRNKASWTLAISLMKKFKTLLDSGDFDA